MPVERLTAEERERLREFGRIVQQAQREIATRIQLATRAGDLSTAARQRRQLARVVEVLEGLAAEIDPRARRIVRDAFQRGAVKAAADMANAGVPAGSAATLSFNGVSAEAVQVLQDAVVSRLQDGRTYVGRQTMDIYAKAGKRAALRSVLGVDGSTGAARRSLAADLLKDKDLAAQLGRAGTFKLPGGSRQWSLQDYTDMVVRTTTREAVIEGATTRMVANGITLARCVVSASACEKCQPYAGKLVDLAGTSGGSYEGEAVMNVNPIPVHPRCTCAIAPVATRVDRIRRDLARA